MTKRHKIFQRTALSVVALSVSGAIAVAVLNPPKSSTHSPRAEAVLPAVSARATVERFTLDNPRRRGAPLLHTAKQLSQTFDRLGYDLEAIREAGLGVPRVFLTSLPSDMRDIRQVENRKAVFFRTVLPLVLKVNEQIQGDRRRLQRVREVLADGGKLDAVDRLWLVVLREKYKLEDGSVDALLKRVDVVPVSLALAQAAEESGWGTSRFAQEGNALFGQWTFKDGGDGIVPEDREEGKNHKVRAFPSLADAVSAYMRNLNTHPAYREFRNMRAAMRRAGTPLDGFGLAATLHRYSERGDDYVGTIRVIIDANALQPLDRARLNDAVLTAQVEDHPS